MSYDESSNKIKISFNLASGRQQTKLPLNWCGAKLPKLETLRSYFLYKKFQSITKIVKLDCQFIGLVRLKTFKIFDNSRWFDKVAVFVSEAYIFAHNKRWRATLAGVINYFCHDFCFTDNESSLLCTLG